VRKPGDPGLERVRKRFDALHPVVVASRLKHKKIVKTGLYCRHLGLREFGASQRTKFFPFVNRKIIDGPFDLLRGALGIQFACWSEKTLRCDTIAARRTSGTTEQGE
jgi:hypothetical protein